MTSDQIDDDLDAVFVRGRAERSKVLIRAVTRRDLVKIGDIIARITERRFVERVQPDRRKAHVVDVRQLLTNAVQIADAVSVRVVERLRIDVVKDCG